MSSRAIASVAAGILAAMVWLPVTAAAQEESNAGKKDHLTALPAQLITPKKTPDGQPDFQGTWGAGGRLGGFMHSIEEGFDPTTTLFHGWAVKDIQVNLLIDPMRGRMPYLAWTEERRNRELVGHFSPIKREDIEAWLRCLPAGVPRANLGGATIRQLPGYVVFLDVNRTSRIIPIDNSPHIDPSLKLWMGDSRGRWEGNTLVIETTNNNDQTEFDAHGTFHSDQLRVVERLTLVEANTIYYEATVEDPKVFTRPWKLAATWDRNARPQKPWENQCYGAAQERNNEHTIQAGKRAVAAGIKGIHTHDPTNITRSYAPAIPLTEEEKALAPPTTLGGVPHKYDPSEAPPLKAPDPAGDYQIPDKK